MITYEQARPFIDNGDFVFFKKSNSLVAKLVKTFTGSDYYHCAIAFWMKTEGLDKDQLFIVEQYPFGRRIVKLSSFQNKQIDIIAAPIDWKLYAKDILSGTGSVQYSYVDFFSIFLKESFNVKIGDFKGEVCSEMLAKLLVKHSIMGYSTISPNELFNFLISKGYQLKLSINQE